MSSQFVHYSTACMCCSMQCAIVLPHLGLVTPLTVSAHTQARVNLQQSNNVCGLDQFLFFHRKRALHFIYMLCKCAGDLSVPISLSHTQTSSPFPALLFLSVCPFSSVTSSLFLAHSLVIVQQSTRLCMLSKRKPLHFLLCSQFILIDCSLTFLYVQ